MNRRFNYTCGSFCLGMPSMGDNSRVNVLNSKIAVTVNQMEGVCHETESKDDGVNPRSKGHKSQVRLVILPNKVKSLLPKVAKRQAMNPQCYGIFGQVADKNKRLCLRKVLII